VAITIGRDDEHRLVALIAENVDATVPSTLVVENRWRRRACAQAGNAAGSQYTCEQCSRLD